LTIKKTFFLEELKFKVESSFKKRMTYRYPDNKINNKIGKIIIIERGISKKLLLKKYRANQNNDGEAKDR
jgi:hypothetical protein